MVNKIKESIIFVRMGSKNLSLAITDCHHSASLLMPMGDPRDGFFYHDRFLYSHTIRDHS